jgi:hypothetical protein
VPQIRLVLAEDGDLLRAEVADAARGRFRSLARQVNDR